MPSRTSWLLVMFPALLAAQRSSPVERQLGAAGVWAEARYNYAYWDAVRANWDSAFAATVTSLGASPRPTDLQFFRRLRRWGALLDDGQLEILPPVTIAGRVARTAGGDPRGPGDSRGGLDPRLRVARDLRRHGGEPLGARRGGHAGRRAQYRLASAAAAPRRHGAGSERHAQRAAHGSSSARAAGGGTRSRHARGWGDLGAGELIRRSRRPGAVRSRAGRRSPRGATASRPHPRFAGDDMDGGRPRARVCDARPAHRAPGADVTLADAAVSSRVPGQRFTGFRGRLAHRAVRHDLAAAEPRARPVHRPRSGAVLVTHGGTRRGFSRGVSRRQPRSHHR